MSERYYAIERKDQIEGRVYPILKVGENGTIREITGILGTDGWSRRVSAKFDKTEGLVKLTDAPEGYSLREIARDDAERILQFLGRKLK